MANYISGINNSTLNNYKKSNELLQKFIDLTATDQTNKYVTFAKYIKASNDFTILKPLVTEIRKSTNRKNIKDNNKKIEELVGKYGEIEKNLKEVIEKSPNLEDAYVILGNYYYLKDDKTNCIELYKKLIEKFPTSRDIDIYKGFLKGLEKIK